MFDKNEFKRFVKDWIFSNPEASTSELVDYCEELIPTSHFSANKWLIDQTVYWHQHIVAQREKFAPEEY